MRATQHTHRVRQDAGKRAKDAAVEARQALLGDEGGKRAVGRDGAAAQGLQAGLDAVDGVEQEAAGEAGQRGGELGVGLRGRGRGGGRAAARRDVRRRAAAQRDVRRAQLRPGAPRRSRASPRHRGARAHARSRAGSSTAGPGGAAPAAAKRPRAIGAPAAAREGGGTQIAGALMSAFRAWIPPAQTNAGALGLLRDDDRRLLLPTLPVLHRYGS